MTDLFEDNPYSNLEPYDYYVDREIEKRLFCKHKYTGQTDKIRLQICPDCSKKVI